jgi:predicted MFS family arabinose efflux permease
LAEPTATRTANPSTVFWRYWTGSTISGLGTAVTSVALPLTAVLVVHASAFSVAAIAAAGGVPWLVLGLPAGVFVARLPLHATQVAMDLLRAAAIGSVPVVYWAGVLTVAQLIGVALVVGSASVIFAVANSTMIPAIVPRDELIKRNSFMYASRGVAQLAGPGLGGVLVDVMGAASCMVLDAASYVASAVVLWALPRPERLPPTERPAEPAIRQQISDGIAFIGGQPVLRACFLLATAANFVGPAILTLTPLYVVRTLHEHAYVLGLVYAAEGAGALVGASLTPRLTEAWGSARVVLRCSLPVPVVLLLLPLAFKGWGASLYGLGIFGFTATLSIVGISVNTNQHRAVPNELLPRVLATTRFVTSGGAPLGALLAGGLATAFGVRAALVVVAALGLATPLSTWTSRELRRRINLEDQ